MQPRDAARALAIGRIALGAALLIAPRVTAAAWVGEEARGPGATVLTRALGARDMLLGAMVLHTVDRPEVAPRWLSATAACDAVDCVAALAVRDELPARSALGMAMAGGSAVLGAALSRALADQA